tara:strand:- start:55993 stop:56196 length:204 start_codon:yes stop_codon:yes gene_type:complete
MVNNYKKNKVDIPQTAREKGKKSKNVKINNENSNKQAEDSVSELGGPEGPEPTRFGDWERNGRCIDF